MALTAMTPVTRLDSAAAVGTDDYPSRLKSAAQDALVDPWLFYNRECTSFVAWRLNNDAGVGFHNYYLDVHWGDASNWKYAALQARVPVDSTPERGAVAWWAKGSPGSSRGHVAWVSGTTSTSITIEEYNYLSAGRYDRRTISSTSSMWPSAFIHVGGHPTLRNTAAPTISGTPKVGAKLTARPGTWTPSGSSYSYQWLADGVPVSWATNRSFAPRAFQLGKRIQVRVTASTAGAERATATSARTGSVARGDLQVTKRPSISGTPQIGVKLTASSGTWSPSEARYRYQWLAGGVPISGATHRSYNPRVAQLRKRIQVEVTASAAGTQSRSATSSRTTSVVPGSLRMLERPTVTGTPQVDSQLSATSGTWSRTARYHYQWNAGGTPVPDATGPTFSPTADQLSQRVSVTVAATRAGYAAASSGSTQTAAVELATFAATGAPKISGTPQVDQPLAATPGRWSPIGTPSYRWFVAGARVPGATGSTFTPGTDDVREQVTVKVRMTRPGYKAAASASAATAPIMSGTFQNSSDPSIVGTPQVGRLLTAEPGGWSPEPTLDYLWYADGRAIAGATAATFTPTAAQLARRMTVEVTARRPGYLTALTASAPTARVASGTITTVERPTVSGSPLVGDTMTASPGTWSVKPSTVGYQWYADKAAISGATTPSYSPTTDVLDQRLSVRVTVSLNGYSPASKGSRATTPVVLGQTQFTSTPTLTGTAELGRRLTANPGSSTPSNTTMAYTWLRAGEPIAGATGSRYRLVADDVGHRIAVQMTLSASHWTPSTATVGTATVVRSVPELDVRSKVVGHKVLLRLSVVTAGIPDPTGKVIATERGERVGSASLTNGRGDLALRRVPAGVHRYQLTYEGPLQTTVTHRIDVTVP